MDNPETLPISGTQDKYQTKQRNNTTQKTEKMSNTDSNKITWVNPGANYTLLDTINCMDNNK